MLYKYFALYANTSQLYIWLSLFISEYYIEGHTIYVLWISKIKHHDAIVEVHLQACQYSWSSTSNRHYIKDKMSATISIATTIELIQLHNMN